MTSEYTQREVQPSLWLPQRQPHDLCPANEQTAQVQHDRRLMSTPLPQPQVHIYV